MNRLKYVKLSNYRCFEETEIELKELSILVGKNNAGKSTLIEALRLISLAGRKSKVNNKFIEAPKDFNIPNAKRGIILNVSKLKIDLDTIGNFYNENISNIISGFEDKSKMEIYIKKQSSVCYFL